jgi:hypothetical protein
MALGEAQVGPSETGPCLQRQLSKLCFTEHRCIKPEEPDLVDYLNSTLHTRRMDDGWMDVPK